MARMRQQFITSKGFSEAEAVRATREHMAAPRRKPEAREQDARRHDLLKRTVEAEVIPRLLMLRRPAKTLTPKRAAEVYSPSAEQVSGLVQLLLTSEQPASATFVEAMRDVGTSPESLYLDLLTPAARQLGTMWEEDLCDFTDVTVGLIRLQSIMRILAPAFIGDVDLRRTGPRALLVQTPGEQHGLGLSMVVQFFTRAGWNVWSEPVATGADLVDMVRHEFVSIVGISMSCSERLDAAARDIRAIRRESRNPAVGIMVGGPLFIEHPQLAAMIGADATASNGREAVQQAQSLVSLLARER
jgi:methanogenic corrinoid protein MtbC1